MSTSQRSLIVPSRFPESSRCGRLSKFLPLTHSWSLSHTQSHMSRSWSFPNKSTFFFIDVVYHFIILLISIKELQILIYPGVCCSIFSGVISHLDPPPPILLEGVYVSNPVPGFPVNFYSGCSHSDFPDAIVDIELLFFSLCITIFHIK